MMNSKSSGSGTNTDRGTGSASRSSTRTVGHRGSADIRPNTIWRTSCTLAYRHASVQAEAPEEQDLQRTATDGTQRNSP
jgi:hypothetical protein